MRKEYVREGAFWGDQFIVRFFETHKGMPGFAPEEYEVQICDIWAKYSDWERRIYFKDVCVLKAETIKEIAKEFSAPFKESKWPKEKTPTPQPYR